MKHKRGELLMKARCERHPGRGSSKVTYLVQGILIRVSTDKGSDPDNRAYVPRRRSGNVRPSKKVRIELVERLLGTTNTIYSSGSPPYARP